MCLDIFQPVISEGTSMSKFSYQNATLSINVVVDLLRHWRPRYTIHLSYIQVYFFAALRLSGVGHSVHGSVQRRAAPLWSNADTRGEQAPGA